MIQILLALQGHAAGAEAGPASPFEVNFGLFLWTWVVFLILLAVLWKYAWPSILRATEERERKIRDQLAEAERINADAKVTLAEAEKRQAEARSSAQQLLAEARSAVEKERAAAVAR
ncbi:MAG: ATP synthase F0 subunit B, partial [Gemmatimonadales bacterium]